MKEGNSVGQLVAREGLPEEFVLSSYVNEPKWPAF